jgi:D-3-phosphoglycerate dehydrogenase / 2-oxoglutarate reductase
LKYKIALPEKWLGTHHDLINTILVPYTIVPYSSSIPEQYLENIIDCDAIISDFSYFGEELMARLENLKIISLPGTGYWDYVDVGAASKRNIAVANITNYASTAIAEYTFGLLIGITRKIFLAHQSVLNNQWGSNELLGMSLKGKILGLIGLGSIGAEVARLANAFGMDVICYTKNPRPSRAKEAGVTFCDLEELLNEADIISLHLGLNDETKGFMGRKQFSIMRENTYLINTARGGLVDTDALYDALKANKLAGAALDVTNPEPLPINHKLLSLENIIVTPHIAAFSEASIKNSVQLSLENIELFFKGECNKIVNAEQITF